MPQELIAVVDVGKTHSKLTLVEAESGVVTWSTQRESTYGNRASPAPNAFRQLGTDGGVERWLIDSLKTAPGKGRIRTIVPVAHGAAAALADGKGRVLAVPDYEDAVFDSVRETYTQLRDPFPSTYSPALPFGLNLGIQLFYLQSQHADLFRQAEAILLYPQYWAWRLSGVKAREITSLGCHTDLWLPRENRFSSLAARQGWAERFPAMRRAGDVLGVVTTDVATTTGLDPSCRVLCGIHDSNASYLCHRMSRPADEQFAVVSSGTWTVIMAHGADLARLREDCDMLANVDALGTPVPTARFMGGREYEAIAGSVRTSHRHRPTLGHLIGVLEKRAFARPDGKLVNAESLDEGERGALATLYCALQTDRLLDLLGTAGPVIVDGPLAANSLYAALLVAFRPHSRVLVGDNHAGPAECARFLCGHPVVSRLREVEPLECVGLADYRSLWRRASVAEDGSLS
jgi:L-fuculokinase